MDVDGCGCLWLLTRTTMTRPQERVTRSHQEHHRMWPPRAPSRFIMFLLPSVFLLLPLLLWILVHPPLSSLVCQGEFEQLISTLREPLAAAHAPELDAMLAALRVPRAAGSASTPAAALNSVEAAIAEVGVVWQPFI